MDTKSIINAIKDDEETVTRTIDNITKFNNLGTRATQIEASKYIIKDNTELSVALELGVDTINRLVDERDIYKDKAIKLEKIIVDNNVLSKKELDLFINKGTSLTKLNKYEKVNKELMETLKLSKKNNNR